MADGKTKFEYDLDVLFWDLVRLKRQELAGDDEASDEAAPSLTVQEAEGSVQTDAPTEKG